MDLTEEEDDDFTNPRKFHHQDRWKIFSDSIPLGQFGKSTRQRICEFGRPDLALASFYDSVPAYCIEKERSSMGESYATDCSENRVEECFGNCSTTSNQATSNRVLRDPYKFHLRVQVLQNAEPEDEGRVTKIEDLVHTFRTQS